MDKVEEKGIYERESLERLYRGKDWKEFSKSKQKQKNKNKMHFPDWAEHASWFKKHVKILSPLKRISNTQISSRQWVFRHIFLMEIKFVPPVWCSWCAAIAGKVWETQISLSLRQQLGCVS
jgi:hypothetical protein